jgi:hypothetical protein
MTTNEVQSLVWRGAFSDEELDKALRPGAHWHEHAFSDSTQTLYLISVSPVAVELTAHNSRWQPGLAHMILLEGEHFTAVLSRAQQRAELTDHMRWENDGGPRCLRDLTPMPARPLSWHKIRRGRLIPITSAPSICCSASCTRTPAWRPSHWNHSASPSRPCTPPSWKLSALASTQSVEASRLPPQLRRSLSFLCVKRINHNHNHIGTEHLLLGLIATADDGLKLLTSLTGLSGEELRRHVVDHLAAHPQPEAPDMGRLTFLTPEVVKHIILTAEQLSLITEAANKAETSIDTWIKERLLAAARDETSTDE